MYVYIYGGAPYSRRGLSGAVGLRPAGGPLGALRGQGADSSQGIDGEMPQLAIAGRIPLGVGGWVGRTDRRQRRGTDARRRTNYGRTATDGRTDKTDFRPPHMSKMTPDR